MKKRKFKFISVVTIICMMLNIIIYTPSLASTQSELLDITRNVNVQSVKQGDTFDVRYTITPKAIPVQDNNKEKDIVLVIDTSTSMNWIPTKNRNPYSNEKSRLTIIKEVAREFVSKFNDKDKNKVNIALVDYNKIAGKEVNLLNMGSSTNVSKLTSAINSLKTDSNTNIGDGLRLAYYLLNEENNHEKYIILMTDGYANTYSVNTNGSYYMGSGTSPDYDCKSDTDPKGLEYAKKVASEKIASSGIKSFIVGFSSEANSNNKQIADAGRGTYHQAVSETAVSDVYDQIQKKIQSTIYGVAEFQETFNSNLEIADLNNLYPGLSISGNKLIGNFNVEYTLNSTGTEFVAAPISFTVKYKAKDNAINILGSGGNSSFGKITVSNNTQTKYFEEKSVAIIQQNGEYIDISRSLSKESVKIGEVFSANYSINTKPMPVIRNNTQKDIVLVIDTSGSMSENIKGIKKIDTIKTVAKNFIDKFKPIDGIKTYENFNIGIVEYGDYALKVSDIMPTSLNSELLKGKIDKLEAGGTTNIGDGIRTAKVMLNQRNSANEKYIILMTDGEANSYSKDKNGKAIERFWSTEYLDDYFGNTINTVSGSYSWIDDSYKFSDYVTYTNYYNSTNGLSYAKNVVSNMLKNDDKIKQFLMVGFGSEATGNNAEIVNAANTNEIEKGKYYPANDQDALQVLYNQFADNILSKIHGTMDFQETFNNNLEVENANLLPYGLKVEGNKVVGKIDVEYTLNSQKTQFIANPINLAINYKAKSYGEGILGDGTNSSFAKMSVASYNETKYLDKRIIELKDGTPPTAPVIEADGNWSNKPVAVNITPGVDLQSGVKRTEYKLAGLVNQDWTIYSGQFNVNNEGETVLSVRSIDNEENISPIAEKTIKVDMTPPANPTINWDPVNKRVTIVPGTDPLSGLNKTQYCLVIGENTNENWIDYSMPFTLTNTNNTIIKAKSIDRAGNVSDITERELESDRPEVKIKVRDASGLRDVYDVTSDNSMKRVDKTLDPEVRLQGEAYADINLESEGTDDVFQYKIIQYTGQPSELNLSEITDWNTLDLQQQQVNEDVVTDKKGYLNQRSYDVNHIQTGGNTKAWEDKENVFKNPSSSIGHKSASAAAAGKPNEYGQWENCAPYTTVAKDGKATTATQRWVTNMVFTNTVLVDSGYKTGYKEASKFWGYLKVDVDGYYVFGGSSDDGSVAYLTVDGTSHKLFDMFKVQGTTFGTTNKHLYLSKDKYYPIYLEYFNWGEAATFLIKYKYIGTTDNINTTVPNSNNIVPSTWFYPSKNITPGEYGTTIFSGSTGVKIPTDSGKYYIIYRAGKKATNGSISTVSREGTYGPFIVEQKAGFNLERVITDPELAVGSELEIKYTITPQPFDVYSVYPEGSENIPLTYTSTVSNFKYDDILPVGLTPIKKNENTVINGQKVNINLSEIVTYVRDGNIYKAEPINFSVHATINESKEFLLQGKEATITYTDIDNAQRQLNFNDLSFVAKDLSSILKHGIFVKNNSGYIRDKEDINKDVPENKRRNLTVVKDFIVTLAMIAEVNNPNDTISVKVYDNYAEGTIVFKKYELKENGEINSSVKEEIVTKKSTKNQAMELKDTDSFKLSKGKKYLIVYTINPQGSKGDVIRIESYINNPAKDNVKFIELFIENLPTLK